MNNVPEFTGLARKTSGEKIAKIDKKQCEVVSVTKKKKVAVPREKNTRTEAETWYTGEAYETMRMQNFVLLR